MLAAQRAWKVTVGTGTITWPGGSFISNTITVTHGLGVTPVVTVVVSTGGSFGLTAIPVLAATTLTSTTFAATVVTVDGNTPAGTSTTTFYWIAVG